MQVKLCSPPAVPAGFLIRQGQSTGSGVWVGRGLGTPDLERKRYESNV